MRSRSNPTSHTNVQRSLAHGKNRGSRRGPSAPRLCPASCKGCRVSHVGTAVGVSGFTICVIDRKYAAPAHGGCTHPARPEATTERIGTHTAGAGPSRLCPASRKGGCPSAIDHARAAARASCCAIRAVDREYATPTHGGCANTLCAKTTPKCANRTGTRPSRLCKASKEIPRRKIVCAG